MKVIVLGGAGMLGHQVWQKCLEVFGPHQVACTLHKSRTHYTQFGIFENGHVFDEIDLQDFSNAEKVLQKFSPDYIVNAVGITLRKKELHDLALTYNLNGMLPHRLALWGHQHKARVIHLSTDCVFDGAQGHYSEMSVPTAKDHYGKSKFLGEIRYDNALTLRFSAIGRELEGKTELLEWFLSQKNQKVKGFAKAMYSGLSTNVVAEEVVKRISAKTKLHGLYQMAGESVSKYELLKMINEIFHVNAEIEAFDQYVADKTLSSELYSAATGFVRPHWKKMLTEVAADRRVNYGV